MFWSRIFKDVIEFQTRRWTTRLNSCFLIRVLSTLQALTTFSRMKLFLYFLEKKILILKTLVLNLKMLVSRFKKSSHDFVFTLENMDKILRVKKQAVYIADH